MKLLWFTDLHIVPPGGRLKGVDPAARFAACLARALEAHGDADLLVITGDIAQKAEEEAYGEVARLLAGLPVPHRLLPGNHDSAEAMDRRHYRAAGYSAASRHHERRGGTDLLYLNTARPDLTGGALDRDQLDWLAERLDGDDSAPALLFMHHPPFPTGIPAVDEDGFDGADALRALLVSASRRVHLFCGHCHRNIAGTWSGIPFTVLTSVHLEFHLNLFTTTLCSYRSDPAFAVILAERDHVAVHFESAGARLPADETM